MSETTAPIEKLLIFSIFCFLIFIIWLYYSHEPSRVIDRQHTDVAESVARKAWIGEIIDDSSKDNPRTIGIDTRARAKGSFITEIEGSYELDGFEDAMGRSGVRDSWRVQVAYRGDRDNEDEWKDEDNYEVTNIR